MARKVRPAAEMFVPSRRPTRAEAELLQHWLERFRDQGLLGPHQTLRLLRELELPSDASEPEAPIVELPDAPGLPPQPELHSKSKLQTESIPVPALDPSPDPLEAFDLGASPEDDSGDSLWSAMSARTPRLTSEGVLWFLGIVLVLAGSLYFTRSNWSDWSEAMRASVVAGGLVAYEALFVGIATLLGRRGAPLLPTRALAGVGAALLPMIALALCQTRASSPALFVVFAVAAVSLSALAARRFGRGLALSVGLASAATIVGVASADAGGTWGSLAGFGAIAAVACAAELVLRAWASSVERATPASAAADDARTELGAGPFAWSLLHLLYLAATIAAVLLTRGQVAPPLVLGPVLACAAALIHRATARTEVRAPVASIAITLGAVLALCIAISGPLAAIPARVAVLVTAAFATYALAAHGWREERKLPFALALLSGLFVYFFLPAPFDVVIELLLSSAKSALGYGREPLPIAYYGLTFLPYLGLLWWMGRKVTAHRSALANTQRGVLLALTLGLVALAFTEMRDARPVLFTLPIYVLAWLWEARAHRSRWLFHLAGVGTALLFARAGHALAGAPGIALGLAASGLALLPAVDRKSPLAGHAVVWTAVGGFGALAMVPMVGANAWLELAVATAASASFLQTLWQTRGAHRRAPPALAPRNAVARAPTPRGAGGVSSHATGVAELVVDDASTDSAPLEPTPLPSSSETTSWSADRAVARGAGAAAGWPSAFSNPEARAALGIILAFGAALIGADLAAALAVTSLGALLTVATALLAASFSGADSPQLVNTSPRSPFVAPARALAPLAAAASVVLALAGGALPEAAGWLAVSTLVLAVSPWTSRTTLGLAGAVFGLGALAWSAAGALKVDPPLALAAVSILVAALARTASVRDWQSARKRGIGRVLRPATTTLSIGAAVIVFGQWAPQPALHLAALLFAVAFATSGAQLLASCAWFLGGVALSYDAMAWLEGALGTETAFMWTMVGLLAVWTTLTAALDRWTGAPRALRARPAPNSAGALTAALSFTLALASVIAISVDERNLNLGAAVVVVAVIASLHHVIRPTRLRALAAALMIPIAAAGLGGALFGHVGLVLALSIAGAVLASLPGATARTKESAPRGRSFTGSRAFVITGGFALAVALIFTRLSTHGFLTAGVLSLSTISLIRAFRRRPSSQRFSLAVVTATAAVSWTWFGLGRAFAHGSPETAILPFLGVGFVALAFGLLGVRRIARWMPDLLFSAPGRTDPTGPSMEAAVERSADAWSTALAFLALATPLFHLVATAHASGREMIAAIVALGLCAVFFVRVARRDGHTPHAFAAVAALILAWTSLRHHGLLFADLPGADGWAALAGAFLFAGVHAWSRRDESRAAFERASRWATLVLPLIGAAFSDASVGWRTAILGVAASATYSIVARMGVSKLAGPLAALALDVALVIAGLRAGVSDPQLYALPIAASILLLSQLYRRELSPGALATLRLVALGGAYLVSIGTVLAFDSPQHSVVMAAACVVGALLGVALRVRSYLLLGAGFLVADLATSVVRFGLSGQTAATLVLTGLGLLLLSALIVLSLNRSSIVTLVGRLRHELAAWSV